MNLLLTSLWLIGMTFGGAILGHYFGAPHAHIFWTFVGGIIGFILSLVIRFGAGSSGDSGWNGFNSFDSFSCNSSSDSSSCD